MEIHLIERHEKGRWKGKLKNVEVISFTNTFATAAIIAEDSFSWYEKLLPGYGNKLLHKTENNLNKYFKERMKENLNK